MNLNNEELLITKVLLISRSRALAKLSKQLGYVGKSIYAKRISIAWKLTKPAQ